jgi:nitroreductase
MDVFEAIRERKSVRSYDERPVPAEVLVKILEAGRIAPSASNVQPWHFIIVTDLQKRAALSAGRYAKFLKNTPVVIAGLGDREASPKWHAVDVTIAMENMVLAATAEGLGTCWIGSFHESEVKTALSIPDKWEVVAMLALGYEKERMDITRAIAKRLHKRKALSDITSYESFGAHKPT